MKPLYGIIPYFGREYTIVFEEEKLQDDNFIRQEIRGYGKFPFNKYPNIPVINLYQNNKIIEFIRIQNELRPREENSSFNFGTMKTFLSEVRSLNIKIL